MSEPVHVGEVLPAVVPVREEDIERFEGNPALAPRQRSCVICRDVSAIEHVNVLLYDSDGYRAAPKAATDYLRSLGMAGTRNKLYSRLGTHRKHVDRWLRRGAPVVPALVESGVQRVEQGPSVRWLDAQQAHIDVGYEATRRIFARMDDLEPKELIAVAKLGNTAATARGNLEAKGKALSQVDKILDWVSGASRE